MNQVKNFSVGKVKVENVKVSKAEDEVKSKTRVEKFAVTSMKLTFEVEIVRFFILGIGTGSNFEVFFCIFSKFNFVFFILF